MKKVKMNISLWLQLACLSSIVLAGIAYRFELLPFKLFAGLFALAVLVWLFFGLTSIVKSGVSLVQQQMVQQQTIQSINWLAFGMGLLVIVMMVAFLQQVKRYPPIHDISSDIDNPPEFKHAQSLRSESDNPLNHDYEVGVQQQKAYPDLNSLKVDLSSPEAFAKAQRVAEGQLWFIEYVDEELGHIEATARSPLLGFVDDIVIRIRQVEGGSVIDLRSVSRVGRSDLGANAARIIQFFSVYQNKVD
ncbi:MAG: hypothetical protein ACJAUP_001408 [Cellvibrionaceae bacterium]|jgi:uncharacterized protein (DUF1499 family)